MTHRSDLHERDENGNIQIPDLTRYSSAYLARVAAECERIMRERFEDGVFE